MRLSRSPETVHTGRGGGLRSRRGQLYRCGEYNQCIVKYQELVELGTLDVMELATNLAAVYVSADRPQELTAALKGLKVRQRGRGCVSGRRHA